MAADYSGTVSLYPQDADVAERMRMNKGGRVYLDHGRVVEPQTGPRRQPMLSTPPQPGMAGSVPAQAQQQPQAPPPQPKPRKKSYEELKREADMLLDSINKQTQGMYNSPTAVQPRQDEVPDWLRNYAKENGLM